MSRTPTTPAPFPDRARPVPDCAQDHPRRAFFGYGSLVNLATHDHRPARLARVSGWRRVWQGTRLRGPAFLSVEPAEGVAIDGVLATPAEGWETLDRRERAYLWQPVSGIALAGMEKNSGDGKSLAGGAILYRVDPALEEAGAHPILLSYLDCVLAGYHALFGPAGVAHFFATTRGWDRPVLDDRARPIYSRAQPLAPELAALVDGWLENLGITRIAP